MQSEKDESESGANSGDTVETISTPEQIEAAHTEMAQMYLAGVLQVLNIQGHGELNFLKKTVTTPQGGVYVLQILHVEGPKIDCQKLEVL
ncbi:MAG TPA: hypothetical protein VJ044_13985 [Candidatus Hodarchaeales archaeon]|nr:hypothetical protein [Candidatus Hodarchaeales archaeon]